MPETPKTLNNEEAYNVLIAQVHAPVFFNKLASVWNITPQTPEEARELLLIAGQLRNAHEQDATKQASARGNFYAEAREDLLSALGQTGFQPMAEDNGAAKAAAEEAVKNPLIKEAAIVFSNYMNSVLGT